MFLVIPLHPLSTLKKLDFDLNKEINEGTAGYGASVIEWFNTSVIFVIKSTEGAFDITTETTQITENAFGKGEDGFNTKDDQ